MTQGRCMVCGIAWYIGRDIPRRRAICLKCGDQLQSTTRELTTVPWFDYKSRVQINRKTLTVVPEGKRI